MRSQQIVDEVFAQPKLYVIRDMWMDSFPDTLKQFGFTLVRKGKPFFLGGCNICEYKRLKQTKTFRIPELKADPAFVKVENGDSIVYVTMKMEYAQNKHIVYGPFVSLLPGTYTVRYHLKPESFRGHATFATIDIAGEYGSVPLLLKALSEDDVRDRNRYAYYDVVLKIEKRVNNVEFRLLYNTKNADVSYLLRGGRFS